MLLDKNLLQARALSWFCCLAAFLLWPLLARCLLALGKCYVAPFPCAVFPINNHRSLTSSCSKPCHYDSDTGNSH